MARSSLARVRKVCLSLPEATEVESWGAPTFRIGKIFAMYSAAENHHGEGREGLWVKTPHFTQDMLVRGQPSRYFTPPYVGPQGWTGVYLDDDTDWIALTVLLRDAYRTTAPKRLAALVPDDDDAPTPPQTKAKRPPPPAKSTTDKGGSSKGATVSAGAKTRGPVKELTTKGRKSKAAAAKGPTPKNSTAKRGPAKKATAKKATAKKATGKKATAKKRR